MISADQAFRDAANRAAAAYDHRPAYVSYRTHVHVSVPAFHRERDVDREVEVRTSDDLAVLQDLPRGARKLGHAFPLVPTFDAISYFRLIGSGGPRSALEAYVTDVHPWTFTTITSSADVVVTSLRYYRAVYAGDSSSDPHGKTHIVLEPLGTLTKFHNGDLYLHDVYLDNSAPSQLPTRVTWVTPQPENGSFTCDYGVHDGVWTVDHVSYERSQSAPLHVASFRVIIDATYESFSFPSAPSSPELQPVPAR